MIKKRMCILLVFIFCFLMAEPVMAAEHRGIDVSQWQGSISYRQVKNAGIKIVYIKAGEGDRFVDPYFERNYTQARRAGLNVGLYHYVTARTVSDARRQAHFFASLVNEKRVQCRPAMDFEQVGGLTKKEVNRIAKVYMRQLHRLTGYRPVVYSNAYDTHTLWDASLSRYPLWIADYGRKSPYTTGAWHSWQGFQYSDKGRIPGIRGLVDLDRFKQGIFLKKHEKEKKRPLVHHIKWGDTLYGIALKYHISPDRLAKLNHLVYPYLLFPGQRLIIPR